MTLNRRASRTLLVIGLSVPRALGAALPALAAGGEVGIVGLEEDPDTGAVTVEVTSTALRPLTVDFPDGQQVRTRSELLGETQVTSPEDVMASGPITVHLGDPEDADAPEASWDYDDPGTVQIAIDAAGGTLSEPLQIDVEPGTEVGAPEPTGLVRPGHRFDSWAMPDGEHIAPGTPLLVEEDLTLTAVWNARDDLSVTFVSADQAVEDLAVEGVSFGEEITLPSAEDVDGEGRLLRGWEDSEGSILPPLSTARIQDDAVFTARWTANRSQPRRPADPSTPRAEPPAEERPDADDPADAGDEETPADERTPRNGEETPDEPRGTDDSAGSDTRTPRGRDGGDEDRARGGPWSAPGVGPEREEEEAQDSERSGAEGPGGRGRDLGESSSSDPRPEARGRGGDRRLG